MEYCTPGSGHPNGYTYGWVMNDEDYLYVAMDFTPDNTMDGEKDYAKVYIRTDSGIKEFKASASENKWGKPGFVYTDKVEYQHKVYEFKIPLQDIRGIDNNQLDVVFSAYGTASLYRSMPDLAYADDEYKYLLVFANSGYSQEQGIYGQFVNSDASIEGNSFKISEDVLNNYVGYADVDVAYDSNNQQFLVTWRLREMAYFTVSGDEEYNPDEVDEDSPERIVGQMIDLDGNPIGDNFTIASGYQLEDYISLAYNNFNDNFLIVWAEGRSDSLDIDIKGRTIGFDIDGNLVDSPVIDICISSGEHDKPAIIYSAIENKYLVVWQDYRGEDRDIYGRFVNSDGVLEEEFIICNYAEHQISPAVTYNEQEQNFLVTWSDERDSLSIDQSVYGRLVDLNGQLLGEEALIAFEENSYHEPVAVTYNNGSKKSLILYNENYNHVFAQKVSDNLALDGDKIEIGNIDQYCQNPAVASNPNNCNYVVACEYSSNYGIDILLQLIEDDCTQNDYGTFEFESASYYVDENMDTAYGRVNFIPDIVPTSLEENIATVSVDYTISDGTALYGEDYGGEITGTLNFEEGQTQVIIPIPIYEDEDNTEDTFYISLKNPVGGRINTSKDTSEIIIRDVDEKKSTIRFTQSSYSVNEGDSQAVISVEYIGNIEPTLFSETNEEATVISVVYSTISESTTGKATEGSDYEKSEGVLYFEPDGGTLEFIIQIKEDNSYEGNEKVKLLLSSPTGAELDQELYKAELIIKDNDLKDIGVIASIRLPPLVKLSILCNYFM